MTNPNPAAEDRMTCEQAIDEIKRVLADDTNYQTVALKIGAIWNYCDRAAEFVRYAGMVEVRPFREADQ